MVKLLYTTRKVKRLLIVCKERFIGLTPYGCINVHAFATLWFCKPSHELCPLLLCNWHRPVKSACSHLFLVIVYHTTTMYECYFMSFNTAIFLVGCHQIIESSFAFFQCSIRLPHGIRILSDTTAIIAVDSVDSDCIAIIHRTIEDRCVA